MSQNLSLFHEELLEFLKRESAERIAADSFDEAQDPALKSFQMSLTTALDLDDPLPLSDIIDSYNYLFGTRGPIHLEKRLLEAFDAKELRIYRGLPRVYRKDRPMDSHVKKEFVCLPNLKRLAAEKAVFQIYSGRRLPPYAKVSFFSWVLGDGWGDYVAAFESIEILKAMFPDLQISWIVLIPKHLKPTPQTPGGCKTHLIFYEKQAPVSLIDQEALELLRTSDLVLQIATYYPLFEELKAAVRSIAFYTPQPEWITIGEYGFLESSWFHPRSGNRSMGLHFLEKGILTRASKVASFAEIENQQLVEWLFGSSDTSPFEIEKYKRENHFYFAYLTSSVGGAVYLHALVKAHEMDKKRIDVCSPSIGWLFAYIESQNRAGRPILEIEGVRLELHTPENFHNLNEGTFEKKIRIFCPSSLTSADFRKLVQLSGEFVAVRGNQSYSEVVSANKVFFYDGREHARYFIKDLVAIAENRIGMHRSALEVFRGMGKTFLHNLPSVDETDQWVDETWFQEKQPWLEIAMQIGVALQNPDCIAGFKKLNRVVAEEKLFNDFLCHLVHRQLCHRANGAIQNAEEEAMLPFVEGRAPLGLCLEDLKRRLSYGR